MSHLIDPYIAFAYLLYTANSQTTLQLVRARTLDALIHCLANPSSSSRASYKGIESALCNALRSIVTSCAEILGPVGWGLSADHSTLERDEARQAIELLFQVTLTAHPHKKLKFNILSFYRVKQCLPIFHRWPAVRMPPFLSLCCSTLAYPAGIRLALGELWQTIILRTPEH